MPHISIARAAKAAGIQRSTIYRAIDAGKLSCVILDNGKKAIDPSELERVFPSDRPKRLSREQERDNNTEQLGTKAQIEMLQAQIEMLREHIRNTERDKEDLRQRLDAAEDERRVILRLLTDQRPKSATKSKTENQETKLTASVHDIEKPIQSEIPLPKKKKVKKKKGKKAKKGKHK